jgi:hypothetical protein
MNFIALNVSSNKYTYSDVAIDRQLRELGFVPYTYDPFFSNLIRQSHLSNANTIYVRNIVLAIKRVKHAEPFVIFGETI